MNNAALNSTDPTNRYNPHSETGDLEQTIACNWEILRRVPEFRVVSKNWIASKQFRFQHVGERGVYRDNVYARCALEWMLTPADRYELALFQMKHRYFFWEPENNYGPIIVTRRLDQLSGSIKEEIDSLFHVVIDSTPCEPLWFDQSWPATNSKFRIQFSSLFNDRDLIEIDLTEIGEILIRAGTRLVSGKPITPEDQLVLGQFLFQQGGAFLGLSRDFKIPAIRRHKFYSERLVDQILGQIKRSLPFQRKTGYDFDSKKSFLGTALQWDKFLSWEAHGNNDYAAAAELLPKPSVATSVTKPRPGAASRSERQRDGAASIRQAVRAIEQWYPKMYPVRNLGPSSSASFVA